MKYSETFLVTWMDGGPPSHSGYFDGAGKQNHALLCLFADGVNVMDRVKYGTRFVVTITIEPA